MQRNSKVFSEHKAITKSLALDYYFAHLYHSWEGEPTRT